MEQLIVENINQLYRSHLITMIIYLGLILLSISVVAGVFKFELIGSVKKRILLAVSVTVCSVLLIVSQAMTFIPIYQDHKEMTYTVVDQATLIVKDGSTGIIDRTNDVIVISDSCEKRLIIQSDYDLMSETEYSGTVVYLNHSNYIVWYCFDK